MTLGWEAIHWATKYLRQPDGPDAGNHWQFVESQVRFILWWYSLTDAARWEYMHGVRRFAKGFGKSPFAAVLGLIELLAPVRWAGWCDSSGKCVGCRTETAIARREHRDPYLDRACDHVVGRRVGMPLVQIAATAENQANVNTMRMVRAMVPKKSRIKDDYDLEAGKTIFHVPGGGQLMIITSSPTTEEGALVTFGILDQTESFYSVNGGIELKRVMDRNARKSGSRLLETSNAWIPGRDSIAEETYEAWVMQELGQLKGDAKILYDCRMAPPDIDFDNPEDILRGVDFAYGDAHWVNRTDIVEAILSPTTPIDVSKRFYLNWPEVAEDAWVLPQQWDRMADTTHVLHDDAEITIGFDGSRVEDATAIVGCEISTGFVFDIGIWETRDARGDRIPIPVAEVNAAIDMAFNTWNVWAFFADVKEWEESTKVSWRAKYMEQLSDKVWSVPGGRDPQPIAWDMRSHVGEFTAAAEMVQKEIENGAYRHDGSGVLRRHVVNSRRSPNRWGISVSKEAPKSPNKIDGNVAHIIARHARRLVLGSKQWQERLEKIKHPGKGGKVWSWS